MSALTDIAVSLGFVNPKWINETDINKVDTGTFDPSIEILPENPIRTLNARYGMGAGRAKGVPAGALSRHFGNIEELDNPEVRKALNLPPDYKQSYTDIEDLRHLWKDQESFYNHILSLKGEETKPNPQEPGPKPTDNSAAVKALDVIITEVDELENLLPKGGGAPMQSLVREVRAYISRVRDTAKAAKGEG